MVSFYPTCEYTSKKWSLIELMKSTDLRFLFVFFLFFLSSIPGCARHPWEKIGRPNDVSALWRFIQENPEDPHVPEARARIAQQEYLAGLESNTRYGFRSFLERHPTSIQANDVRRHLEELDFEEVTLAGTVEAYRAFLLDWPEGVHVGEIRKLLNGVLCRQWISSGDASALETAIKTQPDIPCREELQANWERMLVQQAAVAPGTKELAWFIRTFPESKLAPEVRKLFLEKEVDAFISSGHFDKAADLVATRSRPAEAPRLRSRVQAAEARWLRASFDPKLILLAADSQDPRLASASRQWARKLKTHRAQYQKLKDATSFLREPLAGQVVSDSTLEDPRRRWIAAEKLAFSAEEETAVFLLDLLGDPYLEVQRRAVLSLNQVVQSMGSVRKETWIDETSARLEPTARSGVLLLRLAILADLAGRLDEALFKVEQVLSQGEDPEIFSIFLSFDLARRRGLDKKAASLAARFSEAAQVFAHQRTEGWSAQGSPGASAEGWLSLRQIFGLRNLWRAVHEPFLEDAEGHSKLMAYEAELGKWLQRSKDNLQILETWFEDQEHGWVESHPDYLECNLAEPNLTAIQERSVREGQALSILVFSGLPDTLPTIQWAGCCHPRRATRILATVMLEVAYLARRLAPPVPF